jgi:hypothetical protein
MRVDPLLFSSLSVCAYHIRAASASGDRAWRRGRVRVALYRWVMKITPVIFRYHSHTHAHARDVCTLLYTRGVQPVQPGRRQLSHDGNASQPRHYILPSSTSASDSACTFVTAVTQTAQHRRTSHASSAGTSITICRTTACCLPPSDLHMLARGCRSMARQVQPSPPHHHRPAHFPGLPPPTSLVPPCTASCPVIGTITPALRRRLS